jgi:hypothetical protein
MALIITAPGEIYSPENLNNKSIFLAGGITNCPDWQSVVIDGLKDMYGVTIYNPRRPFYDPNNEEAQITWEFIHLMNADVILFWFSRGSINPIVLYELGMWGNSRPEIPILIGCEKGYERTQDVIIQTKLARPNIQIYNDLDDLICDASEILRPIEW